MSTYRKKIGERVELIVNENGYSDHSYAHGAQLNIRGGWNESCEVWGNTLSVDELKDIHYLITRALEQTQ